MGMVMLGSKNAPAIEDMVASNGDYFEGFQRGIMNAGRILSGQTLYIKLEKYEVNQLTEADFRHCSQQWKSRMERCRDRQGEYIEGENVVTVIGNE
ncbi:hypothetical protein NQ318_019555 [Aromia moschata]|uniref:Uncharacterized protein n=1 Tax=Aromia moschata TaxID=1265417 RepID=A0AAV8Z5M7_9CUCU|nr:hypothetical protein NQ318_019555 [Aromia moschata]